ncbi:MAG: peptidylprolyl isomerase [Porticoccaceae bacterium]
MHNFLYKLGVIKLALLFTATLSWSENNNPQVMLNTEKGEIIIELFPQQAPITVDNFVKLVNEFHYDGLIFHRVIKGFMIQTGGFTFDLSRRESPRPAIVNESLNGLKNKRGSVAMARMADPDSAEAQFFINHKSNRTLNARDDTMGYAVFGQVISGMEVVDAIAVVETQAVSFYRDVPVEAIRILSARLLNPEAWTPLPEPKRPETLSFERPIPIR